MLKTSPAAPIRTIVFDLDDTLIETGDVFRSVLMSLCERLSMRLGREKHSDEEILARQNEIDAELLGRKGAKPERFAASLVKTYQEFMQRHGLGEVYSDVEFLSEEGHRAFTEIPELSEDTLDVLEHVSGLELLLYTWGLERIQMPRIRALDLEKHFSEIHCVEAKNEERFRQVLGDRSVKDTLMCGDSLKLDIAPAVAVGCHAAHVVRPEGWAFLQAGVEVSGPYHRIRRLGEIKDVLRRIEDQRSGAVGEA